MWIWRTQYRDIHIAVLATVLKKKSDSGLKCHFNFPFETSEETTKEFKPIHTKNESPAYHAKIKQNEMTAD